MAGGQRAVNWLDTAGRLFYGRAASTHKEPEEFDLSGGRRYRTWIRQSTKGNVESYNLLVSRWEKRIYNYLLRITANREDVLWDSDAGRVFEGLPKPHGSFWTTWRASAPWLYLHRAQREAYSMFSKRRPETDVDELEPEATEHQDHGGRELGFPD